MRGAKDQKAWILGEVWAGLEPLLPGLSIDTAQHLFSLLSVLPHVLHISGSQGLWGLAYDACCASDTAVCLQVCGSNWSALNDSLQL